MSDTVTPEEYAAAGVYDPDAADAVAQLNQLRLIEARGGTIDDILQARASGRLARLAGELLFLERRPRLTVAEAAAAAGVAQERIAQLWQAAGFPPLAYDDARLTPADVAWIRLIEVGAQFFGEPATIQLLRVVGAAVGRIADATVSTFVTTVGAQAIAADPTSDELARANEQAAAMLPQLVATLDALLRQHLVQAARPNVTGTTEGMEHQELAVGFVDVVGSTAFEHDLPLAEVGATIARFETLAADTVAAHGGRVVKFIGDEVMFTADDAATACRIALEIVQAVGRDDDLPAVRAGLHVGDVLVRDADRYGPVVNLAARITKLAPPGGVVASADVRAAVAHDTPSPAVTGSSARAPIRFGPSRTAPVRGVATPVVVHDVATGAHDERNH